MAGVERVPLEAQSVAAFYSRVMEELAHLRASGPHRREAERGVSRRTVREGRQAASVRRGRSERFWRALSRRRTACLSKSFRARFIGKCSPVHLFWGAMDLAVTSILEDAPPPVHPGGIPNLPDRIGPRGSSHEVSSCGFWSGTAPLITPAFYALSPIHSQRGFADAASDRAARSTPLTSASSSCRTIACANPGRPTTCCRFFQSAYVAGRRPSEVGSRRAREVTPVKDPRSTSMSRWSGPDITGSDTMMVCWRAPSRIVMRYVWQSAGPEVELGEGKEENRRLTSISVVSASLTGARSGRASAC